MVWTVPKADEAADDGAAFPSLAGKPSSEAAFPTLGAAMAAPKSKKKAKQTMSLADFNSGGGETVCLSRHLWRLDPCGPRLRRAAPRPWPCSLRRGCGPARRPGGRFQP